MILAINMNPAIDKVYAVDDYRVGKVFRPRAMTATAGGKGLNVARVAHLLGEQVTVTGMIGGSTGRRIEEEVRKAGLDSRFVPIGGESRICINVMDEKNSTSTEILEPGPVVTAQESEAFLVRYGELLEECDVVTASGSLPKGLPADFYAMLIRLAKKKGKKFILDTSGEFFRKGIMEKPYMIKPNMDELTGIGIQPAGIGIKPVGIGVEPTGTEVHLPGNGPRKTGNVTQKGKTDNENGEMRMGDCMEAVRSFRAMGIGLPVVSLGKHGCIAALEDGVYHFTTPDVRVVNTVGSGDSFVAGCAVGLSRGLRPGEIIRLGMACGTANTQFFKTGWIEKDMVEKFLQTVGCTKIG